MSYILDALKRAESERERGAVPGLHSQSVPPTGAMAESQTRNQRLLLAVAAVGLLLLGVLAWRLVAPQASEGSVPRIAASPPAVSQVEKVTPIATRDTAVSIATATTASTPQPTPAAVAAVVAAQQTNKPGALPPKTSPSPSPAPRPVPVPDLQPATAPAAATTPAARIVPMGDLPADVRQTLPKAVITGSAYSSNPAMRMLIINGEVFREGDNPAPDLLLEQIKAKSAVLNFKGLRYSVGY